VSVHVVNSLRWWQCLAAFVGVVIVMCSITPFAVAADQGDNEGAPVIVIARMRVNWCASAYDGANPAATNAPMTVLATDRLQSGRDKLCPKHVDGQSLLDSCCSLRC